MDAALVGPSKPGRLLLLFGLACLAVAGARSTSCDPPGSIERTLVSTSCRVERSQVATSRSDDNSPSYDFGRYGGSGCRPAGPAGLRVDVRYTYRVDGRFHAGDRFCSVDGLCRGPDDEKAAVALASGSYGPAPGRHGACFYDRADPAWSTLRIASADDVQSARRWRASWTIAWVVLGVVLIAAAWRRRDRGRRQVEVG